MDIKLLNKNNVVLRNQITLLILVVFVHLLLGSAKPILANEEPNFTKEEQEWIATHPVIRVANEMDWPPFDFNEEGIPKGLAIEHMNLLANKAGIKVEYISGKPWRELVDLFIDKKIDVMPVFYMNQERQAFTLFTKAYHVGRLGVLINDQNDFDLNNLSILRVGMESSHGSIPMVQSKYPGISILEIEKKEDLVIMLATGQLDVIIGNPFVFYHFAKINQIDSLRLVEFIDFNDEEKQAVSFHVGVRRDLPMLHQIIEKCMASVTDSQMDELRSQWADVQIVEKIDWVLIAQIVAVVLTLIIFLLWNNRRLKFLVAEKTRELRKLNEDLEEKVTERTRRLSETNSKLNESLEELKTLRGIIPICATCKKIRDDSGYWNQLEAYVEKHSHAEFSHGICPDCVKEIYSDLVE